LGNRYCGYRWHDAADGFSFQDFHAKTKRHVSTHKIQASTLVSVNREEVRDRMPILEYAMLELCDRFQGNDDDRRLVRLAVVVDRTLPDYLAEDLELRLQASPLQFEFRPDLADFPALGRSAFRKIDYATARAKRLLDASYLLAVSPAATNESPAGSGEEEDGPPLLLRLVNLATGNVEWSEAGDFAPQAPGVGGGGAPPPDVHYLLHSGKLSKVEFHSRHQIPPELVSARTGPFAEQNYCVAFANSGKPNPLVRHLFGRTARPLADADVKAITPIDPDVLLAVSNLYDPTFAAWRIARHLLPPAGLVTKVDGTLVEIDIGRKFLLGADKRRSLVTLQRLPTDDEKDSIRLTHLPTRLRVVEVRDDKTIAELLQAPGEVGVEDAPWIPRVGDVAIVIPPQLLPANADLQTVDQFKRFRVVMLQVRTTTSGSLTTEFRAGPWGGEFGISEGPSEDRLAAFARRMSVELEGVLIQHGCEVADHQELWRQTRDRSKLTPERLGDIVTDLAQSMELTHVVQAEFAHVLGRGGRNYAVFTLTEIDRERTPVVGRQVAKLEIEFP
jgi:hypothetical protein